MDHIRNIGSISGWHSAMEPSVNLVVLDEEADKECITKDEIECIVRDLPVSYEFHFYNKAPDDLQTSLLNSLSEAHISAELAGKLTEAISVDFKKFLDAYQYNPPFFLSLRKVDEDYTKNNYPSVSSCFHRDASIFTFTKSFYGPGVEYVSNRDVNREFFKAASIESTGNSDLTRIKPAVNPSAKVYRVRENQSVILKGEIYPNIDMRSREFLKHFISNSDFIDFNNSGGLIHRGPRRYEEPCRLVLTINVFSLPCSMN